MKKRYFVLWIFSVMIIYALSYLIGATTNTEWWFPPTLIFSLIISVLFIIIPLQQNYISIIFKTKNKHIYVTALEVWYQFKDENEKKYLYFGEWCEEKIRRTNE